MLVNNRARDQSGSNIDRNKKTGCSVKKTQPEYSAIVKNQYLQPVL